LAKPKKENLRQQRFSRICLAFPEAVRKDQGQHSSYLVNKKIFAYYLDNHHGDGILSVCCKVLPGDNASLIRSDPARFYMPAYIGPRGWVALRLDVGEIDWDEVTELALHSYLLTAPIRLAEIIRNSPEGSRLDDR
jgi:hypothetical protein